MKSERTHPLSRNMKTHVPQHRPSLPEDIIEDILSRIPVKSLLRFRCVSKSWRSLIDCKCFIKTHLDNSTKDSSFAHHMIFLNLVITLAKYTFKQFSLPSFLNQPFPDKIFLRANSTIFEESSIHIIGCCNGLVCILQDYRNLMLWNPATRKLKKLPSIVDKINLGGIKCCGFDCDESIDDYKVFGIYSSNFNNNRSLAVGSDEVTPKIYSLKTDSWEITNGRDAPPLFGWWMFASGKLHWEIFGYSGLDYAIVSFNLKNEVYGIVEQPTYSNSIPSNKDLAVLGGCLYLLLRYCESHFDLRVMKQYGVRESWEIVATIHGPSRFGRSVYPWFSLVCLGPHEILIRNGPSLIIYYPNDRGSWHPTTIEVDSLYETDIYVESLVSLIPDPEQER